MSGEVLIIVGAGPGISLATARRFGAQGFTIALLGRREQTLENYRSQLESRGIRSIYRVADCARESDLNKALLEIQTDLGPPGALLYNAAHIRWMNLLDETAADLTSDFQVNVAGALTAVRAVLPPMRAANAGSLLFTGSSFSETPVPAFGSLSIGKAGLRNLAHGVAISLRETAIKVHYLAIQGRVTAEDPQRSPAAIGERCWQLHIAATKTAQIDVPI